MKSILLPTYFPSLLFWKTILRPNFRKEKRSKTPENKIRKNNSEE